MPTDYDNNLLKEGLLHFRAGDYGLARRYFERALDVADDNSTRASAYFYLSQLTDDPNQKRHYLEEVLAIDAVHPEARRALAILDGRLRPEDIVNPDALSPAGAGTVDASAERFICPKCGGRMVYAPDGKSLLCEYCARTEGLGGQIAAEQDFFAAMATSQGHRAPVSTQILHCEGCGAEFLLPAQELSAVCAYCGSPHVLRQSRELPAPDAILPFAFDREGAARYLSAWVSRKRLRLAGSFPVPRPLYLPVWTFSIVGNIPWSGQVYRDKQMVPVSGEKPAFYHDIFVLAVREHFPGLAALLESFNFSVTAPYDPRYLAGWPAQAPAVSLSQAALEARRIAVERVRAEVRAEYSHVQNLRYQSSAISVDAFKLTLAPVWLVEIPLKNALLRAAVNGVTGAVSGETPEQGLMDWIDELLER